ncbi:MAG: tetratricopeptide repeat protein [Nitrospinota bacterium]
MFRFAKLLFAAIFIVTAATSCPSKAPALLQEAENKWLENDYREAVRLFLQIVDRFPGSPEAETALLRTAETFMLNLGEFRKAVEYFTLITLEYPKGKNVHTAMESMATIFEKSLKDYDQAVIQYQKLIDHGPPGKKDSYQMSIARCFYLKGDYPQAIVEYQTLVEQYPRSRLVQEAEYNVGNAYFVMNKCDLAVKRYRKILENHPDTSFRFDILLSIGVCMEEKEDYANALQIYEEILDKYKNRELIQRKIDFVLSRMKAKNR